MENLYLVCIELPTTDPIRVLVPAETQAKAKAKALDGHLTVRLVGGVEALALTSQGVRLLGDAEPAVPQQVASAPVT